jgi:hypothetical protein
VKTLSRVAAAFVLSSLLIAEPTSAAPDGSLKKMLDTNITLIEYITLKTQLESVERLAVGLVTEWGDYSSVVKLSAAFDYEDSELAFSLSPVVKPLFSTVAVAKPYCRDLIRAERLTVLILLLIDSTPNGWSSGSLKADGFYEKLYKSSKIRVSIRSSDILKEKLPEGEIYLSCEASLDAEGEIKNFSYNL